MKVAVRISLDDWLHIKSDVAALIAVRNIVVGKLSESEAGQLSHIVTSLRDCVHHVNLVVEPSEGES